MQKLYNEASALDIKVKLLHKFQQTRYIFQAFNNQDGWLSANSYNSLNLFESCRQFSTNAATGWEPR